ncbi:TonB-dependent receptor [uncultured Idiomarina sp.]|uniref:TonB-dependent receptor plug domain-containing protein n=1 Tax=uncultured Idiomarina sp. TaxID=352961 RepID=UPI002599C97F|nr:TonB-dependent receptor [uncultured Idiomarina sp.]
MKNMTFRKSLTAAAVAASLGFPALAIAQDAQTDVNAEEEVERIQVTGSRLNRTDVEGATPVMVIDRADIDATGFQSVSDVLRNNSFNVQGSLREDSGNTMQGQATMSLRGLGSNRTLILLNGRRMPGSPVGDGQAQNLNTIPFAAVERIEILSDGASAVYGSDAIGGVVNIIMKEDYNGLQITADKTISDREGGDEKSVSIVGGIAGQSGSITIGLEHDRKDIIFSRDRFFFESYNFNDESTMFEGRPDYRETTGFSQYARNIVDPNTGVLSSMVSDDCSVYGPEYSGVWSDSAYPGDTTCGYEHTLASAASASLDRYSLFVDGKYNINDDHRFFTRALSSRTKSFGRYAPAAGFFVWSGEDLAAETLPDGQTLTELNTGDYVYYRFDNTGPGRDTDQYDYLNDYTVGFEGFISSMNVDYEVAYNRSIYEMHEWGDGYVNRRGLDYAASNGWDPRQPDQSQYSDLVGQMRENSNRRASMIVDRVDFGLQGEGPGMSQWFVGGEVRREQYRDQAQAQNEAGNIIGTSGGTSGGDREMKAIFTEWSIPLADNWDIDLAARLDDYSDFGDADSYKISTRYQPLDNLVVRASAGTGFRAPSLDMLYQQPAFSAAFGRDIPTCMGGTISQVQNDPNFAEDIAACLAQPTQQYDTYYGSNENLGPEESTQYAVGAVYDFGAGQDFDLNFSIDYYYTEIDDTITSITAQDVMWLQFMETIDNFEGLEYDVSAGGNHVAQPTNYQSFDTSGFDISANYAQGIGPGMLNADFTMSYVLEYNGQFTPASAQQDYTDLTLNEYRADITVGYQLGNHSVNWHTYFIPSRCHSTTLNTDTLANATFLAQCTTDGDGNTRTTGGWAHSNVQYNYNTPWDGKVTLGVNNVFDRDPVLDDNYAFDKDLYPFTGRQFLIRYSQNF